MSPFEGASTMLPPLLPPFPSVEELSPLLLFSVVLELPCDVPASLAEPLVVVEPLQAESIDVAIAAVIAQARILFESFISVLLKVTLACIRLHQDDYNYIITEK